MCQKVGSLKMLFNNLNVKNQNKTELKLVELEVQTGRVAKRNKSQFLFHLVYNNFKLHAINKFCFKRRK